MSTLLFSPQTRGSETTIRPPLMWSGPVAMGGYRLLSYFAYEGVDCYTPPQGGGLFLVPIMEEARGGGALWLRLLVGAPLCFLGTLRGLSTTRSVVDGCLWPTPVLKLSSDICLSLKLRSS